MTAPREPMPAGTPVLDAPAGEPRPAGTPVLDAPAGDPLAGDAAQGDRVAAAMPVARDDDGWRWLLLLYFITSLVEALGVSQIYAFMPFRLRDMHMPASQIPQFVGLFSSLIFVFGLPIVPLWGVWADMYSRKVVIIRSALVEAVVFGCVALSQQAWQLGASMLLVGFQLGNTGVMLAALRDVTPRRRLGTAIALFGASSPIGFAIGPTLGGFMIDGLHLPTESIFGLSSALSVGVAVMLWFGSREIRPEVVPQGRIVALAFGAVRSVIGDTAVRRLFAIYGTAFLARQMATPFITLLVQALHPATEGQASAVGLVVGAAPLLGAIVSPVAGWIGDRVGFRPVLLAALAGSGVAVAVMPLMPAVPALAAAATAFVGLNAAVGAMVFGLLAIEVPSERRSTTLNLVYLPLYVAGIVGPAIGAAIVGFGLAVVFGVAGAVQLVGAAVLFVRRRAMAAAAASSGS